MNRAEMFIEVSGGKVGLRKIPGYEPYWAGDDGHVWRLKKSGWKRLKPLVNWLGRPQVCLSYKNAKQHRYLAPLILTGWVGSKPSGMEACHFPDRDPLNNRPTNLRWGTRVENSRDKVLHGTMCRGLTHGMSKLTETDVANIARYYEWGISSILIAKLFGVHYSLISYILRGAIWGHVQRKLFRQERPVITLAQRLEMVALRAEGYTYRSIGVKYGITGGAAYNNVAKGLAMQGSQTALQPA